MALHSSFYLSLSSIGSSFFHEAALSILTTLGIHSYHQTKVVNKMSSSPIPCLPQSLVLKFGSALNQKPTDLNVVLLNLTKTLLELTILISLSPKLELSLHISTDCVCDNK